MQTDTIAVKALFREEGRQIKKKKIKGKVKVINWHGAGDQQADYTTTRKPKK